MCSQARSEYFYARAVRMQLHTRAFLKFKSSCTVRNIEIIAGQKAVFMLTKFVEHNLIGMLQSDRQFTKT